MSSAQSYQDQLQKGGLINVPASSRGDVIEAATANGLTAFVVDCDRARSRSAVLRTVAKAVDFPEFFGGNLDALYDCLCDTVMDQKAGVYVWFEKLHSGDPALEADSAAIIAVCNDTVDFAANNGRVFAYTVIHAGKHPEPVVEQPPQED